MSKNFNFRNISLHLEIYVCIHDNPHNKYTLLIVLISETRGIFTKLYFKVAACSCYSHGHTCRHFSVSDYSERSSVLCECDCTTK